MPISTINGISKFIGVSQGGIYGTGVSGISGISDGTSGSSPPPTPSNAYVAEDGATYYVAEDGSTYYVQESSSPPSPSLDFLQSSNSMYVGVF